jgi:hypothetical protein
LRPSRRIPLGMILLFSNGAAFFRLMVIEE